MLATEHSQCEKSVTRRVENVCTVIAIVEGIPVSLIPETSADQRLAEPPA